MVKEPSAFGFDETWVGGAAEVLSAPVVLSLLCRGMTGMRGKHTQNLFKVLFFIYKIYTLKLSTPVIEQKNALD
jgi:hypothetical protein